MIHFRQLRDGIIAPVLKSLAEVREELSSEAAVELLLGTVAAESVIGNVSYLYQMHGPAKGIFQMEPRTHDHIVSTYLEARPQLKDSVMQWRAPHPMLVDQLASNLRYATAVARVHYWMVPLPLAAPSDVHGHALYWKEHWNTRFGRGTVEQFQNAWIRLVAPQL